MPDTPCLFALDPRATRARWCAQARTARRAFTITELMISLAMVLLLVLAVTQIFRVTTTTIGKGNATGEVVRGLDAARIAMQIDFAGTDAIAYNGFTDKSGILPAARQPAIIINSTSVPAFLGERDMEADNDPTPDADPNTPDPTSIDSDNDGVDDRTLGAFETGRRWFRTDTISFFTGGDWESQTNLGNGGYYGNVRSDEAWVWYGHARVYNGTGELNASTDAPYPLPGDMTPTDNPNNFFANQFVLLRSPMLLRPQQDHDRDPTTAITAIDDSNVRNPIYFVRPDWDTDAPTTDDLYRGTPPTPNVGPFAYESELRVFDTTVPPPPDTYDGDHSEVPPGATDRYVIQDSRVDVAGVDASTYRQRLKHLQQFDSAGNPTGTANGSLGFGPADLPTWYNRLFARTTLNHRNLGRFWINPLVLKPLDAGEVSQASNYLLGGATQFIVEYAGDFLTQDLATGGAVTGALPDGELDYTIDADGVRHIRWYGMPRDVDGDGLIPGPGATPAAVLLQSTDTRPVADYLPAGGGAGLNKTNGMPFEKRLPGEYAATSDVLSDRSTIAEYVQAYADGDINDWSYLAAWGPGDFDGDLYSPANTTHPYTFTSVAVPEGNLRPSLIRVIVQSIDRLERLEEPVSMELVFRVPAE